MGRKIRTSVLLALLVPFLAAGTRATTPPRLAVARFPEAPALVNRALSCLLSHKPVVLLLGNLRLKPGDIAFVRYYVGTIPGSSPTPGEYFIAVYARGRRDAWLLLAIPKGHGMFLPVGNGYRLRKLRHGWQADEGNGGLATYATMNHFAAWLVQHRRLYRVLLTPHREYCSGPME